MDSRRRSISRGSHRSKYAGSFVDRRLYSIVSGIRMQKMNTLAALVKLCIRCRMCDSCIASCAHTEGSIENGNLKFRHVLIGVPPAGEGDGTYEGSQKKRAEFRKSQRYSSQPIEQNSTLAFRLTMPRYRNKAKTHKDAAATSQHPPHSASYNQ